MASRDPARSDCVASPTMPSVCRAFRQSSGAGAARSIASPCTYSSRNYVAVACSVSGAGQNATDRFFATGSQESFISEQLAGLDNPQRFCSTKVPPNPAAVWREGIDTILPQYFGRLSIMTSQRIPSLIVESSGARAAFTWVPQSCGVDTISPRKSWLRPSDIG